MGGGFLVVPALVLLCGISMKDAVGKALLIVAPGCSDSLHYGGFDLRVTMLVTMVAIDGTLVGTDLPQRISPEILCCDHTEGYPLNLFVAKKHFILFNLLAQFFSSRYI